MASKSNTTLRSETTPAPSVVVKYPQPTSDPIQDHPRTQGRIRQRHPRLRHSLLPATKGPLDLRQASRATNPQRRTHSRHPPRSNAVRNPSLYQMRHRRLRPRRDIANGKMRPVWNRTPRRHSGLPTANQLGPEMILDTASA
jgi:hypothetical protein